MVDMSLSETSEVASRWKQRDRFFIEYRALAATIKVIFMSSVRFRYVQPLICMLAQQVERKNIWCPDTYTEVN